MTDAVSEDQVVLGDDRAAEQPTILGWTQEGGHTTHRRFEGTEPEIRRLYSKYTRETGGVDNVLAQVGPGTCHIEFDIADQDDDAGEDDLNIRWELEGRDERIALAYFTDSDGNYVFDEGYIPSAEKAIKLNKDEPDPDAWAGADAAMDDYFDLRKRGVTHFLTSRYILRKTQSVGRQSAVVAGYSNVNQVDSDPGAPSTLLGSIPAGEWLKKAPKVRQVSRIHWEIVTLWWWAKKWSTRLYGGTLAP